MAGHVFFDPELPLGNTRLFGEPARRRPIVFSIHRPRMHVVCGKDLRQLDMVSASDDRGVHADRRPRRDADGPI